MPHHFLIARGHELTEFARVVEHNGRFAVVEKLGEPPKRASWPSC